MHCVMVAPKDTGTSVAERHVFLLCSCWMDGPWLPFLEGHMGCEPIVVMLRRSVFTPGNALGKVVFEDDARSSTKGE